MMTVKEFYDLLPSASKNILSVINQYLLNSMWTDTDHGGLSADALTAMSQKALFYIFNKELNPEIELYFDVNNFDMENITASNFQSLVKFLFYPYQNKWVKLWENVYLQEYNPIWNVDGTETETREFTHGKTTTNTKNLTHTMNKGSTETSTVLSDITQNSRNSFDSVAPVDTDKTSNTGNKTVTGSGYDSDVDTGTDTYADSGKDTETVTRTRGGNIGVTMTTQMLTSEIDMREKFNYFAIVIGDIINELSLRIY